MSRHESVSCDSCMKANFSGKRYKCLVCYDYDLCSTCYGSGVTTARHSTDHPMQCILTRTDFELFYGGDSSNININHPQSFTCPYCAKMGFTEGTLQEHVSVQHSDVTSEVICPICASLPGGDPNHVTDDFSDHLTLEHRGRELYEEPTGALRTHRRLAARSRGGRTRHYTPATATTNSSSLLRESMDPIAELLSHLSGVSSIQRGLNVRTPQQLRELQMHLEEERSLRLPPELAYRDPLQRVPRPREPTLLGAAVVNTNPESKKPSGATSGSTQQSSKFVLASYLEPTKLTGEQLEQSELERADHSLFVQELLLTTLTESLTLDGNSVEDSQTKDASNDIVGNDIETDDSSSSNKRATS